MSFRAKAFACALAVGIVTLSPPRPAQAAGVDWTFEMFEALDANAPAHMVFRPKALWTIWTWLGTFGGPLKPFVQPGLGEVSQQLTTLLGFDPTSAESWAATGLDPELPIAASLFGIDYKGAQVAYLTLRKQNDEARANKVARPLWSFRVVGSIKDETQTRMKLAGMGSNPEIGIDVAKADAAAMATLLGVDAKKGAKALAALRKANVALAGRLSDEGMFTARIRSPYLIVDFMSPFASGPFDWARDEGAVLKLLKKPAKGAGSRLAHGAGEAVRTADAAVLVNAQRMLDTGQAAGRETVLSALRYTEPSQRAEALAQGEKEIATCDEFRPATTSGPFDDFAYVATVSPTVVEVSGVWGLRKGETFSTSLALADDGLTELAGADTVTAGSLFLGGLKAARALPRPGVFGKDLDALGDVVRECGFAGMMATGIFAWPQFALLAAADGAKAEPWAGAVVDNVRNVAFAFKSFSLDGDKNLGVVVASFEGAVAGPVDLGLDKQYGAHKARKVGTRSVEVWEQRGKDDPWIFKSALPGGRVAYGLAIGGGKAIDWFVARPAAKPVSPPPVIAAARLDVPRMIQQLKSSDPSIGMYLDEVAKHFGALNSTFRSDANRMTWAFRLEIK